MLEAVSIPRLWMKCFPASENIPLLSGATAPNEIALYCLPEILKYFSRE
jgi:hypothetical protein